MTRDTVAAVRLLPRAAMQKKTLQHKYYALAAFARKLSLHGMPAKVQSIPRSSELFCGLLSYDNRL
jgi:hypothetical protein